MATDAIVAAEPGPAVRRGANEIAYDGEAARLFGIGFKVALLTLLSLGFYRFWGKTDIRRYLWSRVRLGSDRFEYTGTGKELFLGFLIVLAVLIPLGIVIQTLNVLSVAWSQAAQVAVSVIQTVILLFLIAYAVYRARRYRLSRTLLRGIRFGQIGSAARYGLMYLGYFLLAVLTLGIAKPVGDVALYRFEMENTLFGDRNFDFEGRAGEMMGRWMGCLLLAPFTLGVSLLWYAAYKIRYLTAGTRFGTVSFALPVRAWDLIRIYLPYFFVLILLLGLSLGVLVAVLRPLFESAAAAGQPAPMTEPVTNIISFAVVFLIFGILEPAFGLVLITHRFIILFAERLELSGPADFDGIVQRATERSGAAEGLADALDVGAGIDAGF